MNLRLERLRSLLVDRQLDGLWIGSAANRRYLSGFTGSAGWLYVGATSAFLLTDGRYVEQARSQAPDFTTVYVARGSEVAAFQEAMQPTPGQRVGLEAAHVTLDQWQRWFEPTKVAWTFTASLVEGLRSQKDAAELAAIEAAAQLADQTMAYAYTVTRPGMTEQALAWMLEVYLREHGAQGVAFEFIIASGPNSALPHARPTDRVIQAGEPITFDMGARLANGYHSDLTRTFCLGQPADARFHEVYATVLAAHHAGLAALRPGLTGRAADEEARRVIDEAGYGTYFSHSLGHGVGLEVHEMPGLGPSSQDTLAVDAVVTVEPGIYIPGWGGVRIEDLVLITPDGCRLLSHAAELPVIARAA